MTLKLGEALGSEPSSIFNCVCQRSSNNQGVWCFLLMEKGVMITFLTKSIPTSTQYLSLRKYFSHPSLVMYSFATPPIKLKLRQQIGGGLLIANHLDQSLSWANHKHWAAVRSYLLHSSLQVHSAAAPFTSHGNLRNYAEPKQFSWANFTGIRWIFFIEFYCAGSHREHHRRCSHANDSIWHYSTHGLVLRIVLHEWKM
jgi:hypothetical protein